MFFEKILHPAARTENSGHICCLNDKKASNYIDQTAQKTPENNSGGLRLDLVSLCPQVSRIRISFFAIGSAYFPPIIGSLLHEGYSFAFIRFSYDGSVR